MTTGGILVITIIVRFVWFGPGGMREAQYCQIDIIRMFNNCQTLLFHFLAGSAILAGAVANSIHLLRYAIPSFEVDSADMMPPTGKVFQIQRASASTQENKNNEKAPLGRTFPLVRALDRQHGAEFKHERKWQ